MPQPQVSRLLLLCTSRSLMYCASAGDDGGYLRLMLWLVVISPLAYIGDRLACHFGCVCYTWTVQLRSRGLHRPSVKASARLASLWCRSHWPCRGQDRYAGRYAKQHRVLIMTSCHDQVYTTLTSDTGVKADCTEDNARYAFTKTM